MNFASRRNWRRSYVAVLAVFMAGALMSMVYFHYGLAGTRAFATEQGAPTPGVVSTLLDVCAASAQDGCGVLATSGAAATDVQAALAALVAAPQQVAALDNARLELLGARRVIAAYEALLWSHGAYDGAANQLAAARAAEAAALAAYEAARTDVRAIVDSALYERAAPSDRAIADRVASRAGGPLPASLKAVEMNEEDWRRLERAWMLAERGLPLTQGDAIAIAIAESDPTVQLVAGRVAAHAATIKATLDTAMRQERIAQ